MKNKIIEVLIILGIVGIFILSVFLLIPKKNVKEEIFLVKFDSDGGTIVSSQTVKNNELVDVPVNPRKEGYDFEGWFIGLEKYDFNKPVNEDLILKAKWKIKEILEEEILTEEIIPEEDKPVEENKTEQNKQPIQNKPVEETTPKEEDKPTEENKPAEETTPEEDKPSEDKPEEKKIMYGDLDLDGKITTTDNVILKQYLSGHENLTEEQLKNADVNADNQVNTIDETLLNKFLSGMYSDTLPNKPIKN